MSDDIIVELLKELRSESQEQTKALTEVRVDVRQNKEDLQEHMAQTRAVKSLVEAHKEEWHTRLNKLEEPGVAWKYIKKVIIGLGTVAGATYAILRLLGYV